jgi:dienelactone hydrolase
MRTVRVLSCLAAVAAVAPLSLLAPAPVRATAAVSTLAPATPSGCPGGLTAGSPITPAGGQQFVVCSGRILSFDGTPLDTDVTIPTATSTTPRPLMIMMHGWGNSKTDWESTTLAGGRADQYHWNNAWFASQGYVVLTYSARGFHNSCGKDSATNYIYLNDPACSSGAGERSWTHLADRRWETHDTQHIAGLLVDAGLVDPQRIVATGGSYGGAQSWDLGLSQDKVVNSASTDPTNPLLTPWTSPLGTPLHVAAAAPMYPWTDLADALLQNGRAADGVYGGPADGNHHSPFGVDKQSYVAGLFASGAATAQYSAPGSDPTADLTTWMGAINAGEPYTADPNAAAALAQVGSAFRSPLFMPVPPHASAVPVFVVQGLTDPLFPGFQALDMVNRLKTADAAYPVTVFLSDVGHSYADNPLALWQQAHDAGNAWLTSVMGHTTPANPAVTVTTSVCHGQSAATFTGASWGSIANSVVHLGSAASQSTTSSAPAATPVPEGVKSDPIANSSCPSFASQTDPNQAVYTFPVPTGTLVGAPGINVDVAVNGLNAVLAARLWEVGATGTQTLITRTVYRLEEAAAPAAEHLHFELWPQAWQFHAGDQLRLELTQNDSPTWRSDNQPSSLTFTNLDMSLPLVTVPPAQVAEVPVAPALPAVAVLVAAVVARRRRRRQRHLT